MGRFRLSKDQLIALQDSEDDSDDHYTDEEQEDDEPEHPLGFPAAVTRFNVNPESHLQWQRHFGDLRKPHPQQQFPPLSSHYVLASTASTSSLLLYHRSYHPSAKTTTTTTTTTTLEEMFMAAPFPSTSSSTLSETLQAATDRTARHVNKMSLQAAHDRVLIEKKQRDDLKQADTNHQLAAEALRALLKQHHLEAKEVILHEREAQIRVADANQTKIDQEKAQLEAQERERALVEQQREQKRIQQEQQRQEMLEEQQAKEAAENLKTEYVHTAQALVNNLVQLRASVEPFETSKEVSKRRLQMKKIVNGRVNTLSADPDKVRLVASDVKNAIGDAKQQDEDMKQDTQAKPEMTRGKRYFIDLLASTALMRVQAEGFNGPRGDGFPLANMMALVGHHSKELVSVFSAHIYTVCPTAIPTLPKPTKDADDVELMESLGMIRNKAGDFETFERFLARTEGIISIIANIMASQPSDHSMFGGHKGAIQWLQRFIGLLPKAPDTLPLLTAPVLDAFLVGAGHMMARVFPNEFKPLLSIIVQDIVTRLDEGPIGAPRALRLKIVIEGGFSSFQRNIPPRALSAFYYTGGSEFSFGSNDVGNQRPLTQAFAVPTTTTHSSNSTILPNPFNGASKNMSNPFGEGVKTTSSVFSGQTEKSFNPFGGTPMTFGGVSQTSNTTFLSATRALGEETGQTSNTIFSSASNPFGGTTNQSSTPFVASTPFGGEEQTTSTSEMNTLDGVLHVNTSAPGPFGSTPFGVQNQVGVSHNQFGSNNNAINQQNSGRSGANSKAPCRFFAQGNCRNGDNCPFSHDVPKNTDRGNQQKDNSNYLSLGGQQQQFELQSNNNPFGTQQTLSFGSAVNSAPFGQQQTAPFGASSNVSLFGQHQPSPFGNVSNNPFGQQQQQKQATPFGNTGTNYSNTNSFGSGSFNENNNEGGGRYKQNNKFDNGGGRQKKPCRYFAQGSCRNGANCPFSHDSSVVGGSLSSFGGQNASGNGPFGQPRR